MEGISLLRKSVMMENKGKEINLYQEQFCKINI